VQSAKESHFVLFKNLMKIGNRSSFKMRNQVFNCTPNVSSVKLCQASSFLFQDGRMCKISFHSTSTSTLVSPKFPFIQGSKIPPYSHHDLPPSQPSTNSKTLRLPNTPSSFQCPKTIYWEKKKKNKTAFAVAFFRLFVLQLDSHPAGQTVSIT